MTASEDGVRCGSCLAFFFFNDTATTEIYTLSLHDALPISAYARRTASAMSAARSVSANGLSSDSMRSASSPMTTSARRSEEHTSELQSRQYLVCRLLLEKKKYYEWIYNHVHTTPSRLMTAI